MPRPEDAPRTRPPDDPFDDTWTWTRLRSESAAQRHSRLFGRRLADPPAAAPRSDENRERPVPALGGPRIEF